MRRLRAVCERIDQRRLEEGDWSEIGALLSKALEEAAESGQEWVTIEVPAEEGASTRITNEAVDAEEST
jgi:hypothetical protein